MSMIEDAAAGLAKGAALGSVVPGIGTAIGAAAGGLLGVALNMAPGAAHWLSGSASVAEQAAQAVQAVTGQADPIAAQAALDADAGLAGDLRIALAQLANQAKEQEDRAAQARMDAALADVADARRQTQVLAQAGSPLAWGAAAISLVIVVGFFLSFGLLATGHVPDDKGAQSMLNMMVGALVSGLTGVTGYWIGSTAGSARKTNLLANSVPAQMLSKPLASEPKG